MAPTACVKKVLLLGLGNDLLSDDAVGLIVVRQLRARLGELEHVDIQETCEMGLSLLDYVTGYDRVILLDAIQTGQAPPGHLHAFDASSLAALPILSPHFLGIGEMLALGRALRMPMPSDVRVLAIEVDDPFTVGTQLTPAVEQAIPYIVACVSLLLTAGTGGGGRTRGTHGAAFGGDRPGQLGVPADAADNAPGSGLSHRR